MVKRNVTRRCEIRAAQGEEFVLAGRALSYNEISSNELLPGVREKLMPGCFRASLASGSNVIANLNHNMQSLPLGTTENGTLKIQDGPAGLDFRIQLDRNITDHANVWASVKRGDISQCSFQFVCQGEDLEDASYQGQLCVVRCITQAELIDVSVVSRAFYGGNATAVAARAQAATRAVEADSDKARREKVALLGKVIEKDKRGMDASEVSSNEDWLSSRLAGALASKGTGWRLISVDAATSTCMAVPSSAFDEDESEEECMAKCARFNYGIDPNNGEVILGAYSNSAPAPSPRLRQVIAELRDEADLRRKMRSSAGIFSR